MFTIVQCTFEYYSVHNLPAKNILCLYKTLILFNQKCFIKNCVNLFIEKEFRK